MDKNHQTLNKLKLKAARAEGHVMRRNIYYDATFEVLVALSKEISAICEKTHQQFHDVISAAGIKDPSLLLDESMHHWDVKLNASNIPSEQELINRLRKDFQVRIEEVARVYVPTDELMYDGEGGSKEKEPKEDANRVGLAIETLLHLKIKDDEIKLNDLEISMSKVPEHTWRTRPYWIINIKKQHIAILLNNQYANRTFVFSYKNSPDLLRLAESTKEQLKEGAEKGAIIHHFAYENPEQFKAEIAVAVVKVAEQIEMVKPYETYEEAKLAVQKLGIKTKNEYLNHYREDPRLFGRPDVKYKELFISWADFLRNEEIHEYYGTYEEAKSAVQRLGIKTVREYQNRYGEDPRLPSDPYRKYGETFTSWDDFLKNVKELYSTYNDAKIAIQRLGINTWGEYRKRCKEDPRLPKMPPKKYGEAFVSWEDFLRNEKAPEYYGTYEEAKSAVLPLKISSKEEYVRRYKEDSRLPANPRHRYGKAFVSWRDFLRNEKAPEYYGTYEEAKSAVQRLGIKSESEYRKRHKEDPSLPSQPDRRYGEAFIHWWDFLRNEKPPEFYATYEEAKLAAQKLGIKTQKEYFKRYKEDPLLPCNPNEKYSEVFVKIRDFLRNAPEFYESYEEAKSAVQFLGIKTTADYQKRYKEDPRLPSAPNKKYGKTFIGWQDFLGNSR